MSKKEVTCGITPLKKNQRYGTMKECADKNQVRRYGLYKADSRVVEANKTAKKTNKENSRQTLMIKIVTVRGPINKINKDLPYEKNASKKKEMEKKLVELKKELTGLTKLFKEVDNKK